MGYQPDINIFGNKSRKESFVEKLENTTGIKYSDFENNGSDVFICEKCYKIVLNYSTFRGTALLNHEKFCESIRRKRLPVATPGSVEKPHKTQKISVAEQITRSVEKLCINSHSCTTNHYKKAKKKLDIPDDSSSVSINIENNFDFRESVNFKTFLEKLDCSLKEINRKGETVLQEKNSFELLNGAVFEKALRELKTKVSLLYEVFKTLLDVRDERELKSSEKVTMATMYPMIMQARNKQSLAIQRVYTALVIRSHADNTLLQRLNKAHITLSTSSKKYFMDDLGKYCDEKIVQSLRSGRDGKINGDNLDFRVATHEIRMNVKAKDFHFFASDYTPDRIDLSKYSDKGSIGDANSVRVENFLPSPEEEKMYRESLKIILAREMIAFSNKFLWMKMCIPDHIPHELSEEMSQKSTPFLMPILLKNETSYSDCIDILTSYTSQLEDWYTRAGRGSIQFLCF
ncbi:uncharacterized protein LOC133188164 [Saccostrea echinata]|uniref:uncharacterized protein LOC133188164 n=1 Tax=Saccostrea echinata TaxID=191078 RepID=UPI002A8235FC|nr:uncharacterized protein LOC133188164 [Saccostrea echinata]